MKPGDFRQWAEQVIAQSPAIASITEAGAKDVPQMSRVELATGAQIYVQWVGTAPPTGGGATGEPDTVVTGPPPAPVKVPELSTSGRVRTADVEQHLAALLNNAGHDQVLDVTGYSADPALGSSDQPYGLRVRFHSGASVYGLFRYMLPRGQQPGQGGEFKQREEV